MSLDLVPMRVGFCRAPALASRRDAGLMPMEFPAGAALIRHPDQGDILFDTGYGVAFWQSTRCFPEMLYRATTPAVLPVTEELCSQIDVPPALVILSHLHADHVAGLFDLPVMAPVLTSRAAWVALAKGGPIATLRRGCPELLRRRLLKLSPRFIEDSATVPTPEGFGALAGPFYDIMGDGSLLAVPLPGHGDGQFGVFIPASRDFLIADAAWSRAALRDNMPPPWLVLAQLGDADEYMHTFNALRAIMAARPDVRMWPSHCTEAFG